MDTRINYLYDKSKNNTLCIDTANCSKSENVNLKHKITNLTEWDNLEDTFTSNYIHSFLITIKSELKLKLANGTERIIKINIFHHSFVLLPLGDDKFILCDSWEGIHFMNCRKTKILSKNQIIQNITKIMDGTITNEEFDNMFNNDDNTNWLEDRQKLEEEGQEANIFSADLILKGIRNHDEYNNRNNYLTIKVYELTQHGGKKNKKIKKYKIKKTKKLYQKNKKHYRKSKSKKHHK
mgnify:CR=1 FL=1